MSEYDSKIIKLKALELAIQRCKDEGSTTAQFNARVKAVYDLFINLIGPPNVLPQ